MIGSDGRIRFLGHPVHPMLTDIPIGLWSLTLLWDVVALWAGDFWWEVGFWTLVGGLAAAVPAAISGFVDSRALKAGSRAASTASTHLLLMGSTTTCFLATLIVRRGPDALSGGQAALAVGLTVVGVGLMGIGSWFGGELVFEHGSGVQAASDGDEADLQAD